MTQCHLCCFPSLSSPVLLLTDCACPVFPVVLLPAGVVTARRSTACICAAQARIQVSSRALHAPQSGSRL